MPSEQLTADYRTGWGITRGSFDTGNQNTGPTNAFQKATLAGWCFTASFSANKCLCKRTEGECNITSGVPQTLVLADGMVSPTLGSTEGQCFMVVRVERAMPTTLFDLFQLLFGTDKGQTQLGKGCKIFISLNSSISVLGAQLYLSCMNALCDDIYTYVRGSFKGAGGLAHLPLWSHFFYPTAVAPKKWPTNLLRFLSTLIS